MVYVSAFFTEDFAPKTGLSPTLDGYRLSDDVKVLDGVAMPEVGGGYYKYDFSAYNEDEEYVLVSDGGATLDDVERYKYGGSAEGDIKLIKDDIVIVDGNVDAILVDTGTTLPATLATIEGLINEIKVITDNIPADLEADIIQIKGTCGIWLIAEFTHDTNNDNTIIEFWQYDNQTDFDNETKANAVNKWKQTTTFTSRLPVKAKFDKVT